MLESVVGTKADGLVWALPRKNRDRSSLPRRGQGKAVIQPGINYKRILISSYLCTVKDTV